VPPPTLLISLSPERAQVDIFAILGTRDAKAVDKLDGKRVWFAGRASSLMQRIVVEKKGCGSGCASVLLVLLVVGFIFVYWYVAVALLGTAIVIALVYRSQAKKKARHRSGPRDPWINAVSVALAEVGFTERARNTGSTVGNVPFEGDVQMADRSLLVTLSLFASAEQAQLAQTALLAQPKVRASVKEGRVILRVKDRVLYSSYGRGGQESRLAEVMGIVGQIEPPAAPTNLVSSQQPSDDAMLPVASHGTTEIRSEATADQGDPYEQLRKLGELHAAGVLSDAEFEEKKAELLGRL
jgi:hypothetical protein